MLLFKHLLHFYTKRPEWFRKINVFNLFHLSDMKFYVFMKIHLLSCDKGKAQIKGDFMHQFVVSVIPKQAHIFPVHVELIFP